MRRLAVVAARAVRVVRGLWPDRNPLRRAMDRAEALIVGGLVIAFLAGAPLAAVAAGHLVSGAGSRATGAGVKVWVDPAGRLTGPPRAGSPAVQAGLAMAFTPVAVGCGLLAVGVVAHGVLERRRQVAWEMDWRLTGPQWTGSQ